MTDNTPPIDPFRHHPELRELIRDPLTSFFRDFTLEGLIAANPELARFRDWALPDAAREANRRACLADHEGDLWVFGYGSLMWDPGFDFVEVRHAFAPGVERRFILVDDKGGRGTPEAPGLMAALDHGSGCAGLAFRIAATAVESETERLWRREMMGPAYLPRFIPVETGGMAAEALTFLADHEAADIRADLTHAQQVAYIAQGAGFLGTSRDYLAGIITHFAALGIEDETASALLAEVDGRRSALR